MSRRIRPGDDLELSEPRYVRSLGRAVAILGLLTATRPVLGVAEIASLLGLTWATTHRYVTTLLELGHLERNRSRKYQLSLRVLDLGGAALGATPLPAHARPVLEQLCTTGYTASLLHGVDVPLIGQAASTRRGSRLSPNSAIGTRLPAHCTSRGKVLLATPPDETWRSRLGDSRLVKHAPGTITSKSRIDLQLRNVRKRGYATSDQELWPEVLTVAVSVLDEYGGDGRAQPHRAQVDDLSADAHRRWRSGAHQWCIPPHRTPRIPPRPHRRRVEPRCCRPSADIEVHVHDPYRRARHDDTATPQPRHFHV
jgi:IclR family transcriptional regulator, pca regulon regulatory protein